MTPLTSGRYCAVRTTRFHSTAEILPTYDKMEWWDMDMANLLLLHFRFFVLLLLLLFAIIENGMIAAAHENTHMVNLTLVHSAAATGAVCLDGTVPAYAFSPGFGSGAKNWIVYIQGGAWCSDLQSCIDRKNTSLGSSNYMPTSYNFSGFCSNSAAENPDFYNWNMVQVMYCDGASFSGDVEDSKVPNLYFRGQRIWKAVMAELMQKGMNKADKALLTGCSAGGLTTYLHCDDFKALFLAKTTVKCLSDAGFFLDAPDILGNYTIRSFFKQVVTLQQVLPNLPRACTRSESDPTKCFFPQYLLPYIRTPILILNSPYDSWQIRNILVPLYSDPKEEWKSCAMDIYNCTTTQLSILQDYRMQMIKAVNVNFNPRRQGFYLDSCFIHCQLQYQGAWLSFNSTRVNNKTLAKAVGDWYYDRDDVKEVDQPYPCNPSCYNVVGHY